MRVIIKVLNVECLQLCYDYNSDVEYYEYRLCYGTTNNYNSGLCSEAKGDDASWLHGFASILKIVLEYRDQLPLLAAVSQFLIVSFQIPF